MLDDAALLVGRVVDLVHRGVERGRAVLLPPSLLGATAATGRQAQGERSAHGRAQGLHRLLHRALRPFLRSGWSVPCVVSPGPGIERVTQPVAEQVEGQDGAEDRHARARA